MASTGHETAQGKRWSSERDATLAAPPPARPRIAARPDEVPKLPASQAAFYELICIGWLALAAVSIWIAILY